MSECFTFPSSSSTAVYTVVRDEATGSLSCTCPGWKFKRPNRDRNCKHCDQVRGATPTPTPAPALPQVGDFRFIEPMLAQKCKGDPLALRNTAWEEKYDGIRLIVHVKDGQACAWSRLQNARALPTQLATTMRAAPDGHYDCELVIGDGTRSWDVDTVENHGKERLVVFDLLTVVEREVMGLTYRDRRALLTDSLADVVGDLVTIPDHLPQTTETINRLREAGREGVMVKFLDSTYRPHHRSDQWLKVKFGREATLTIVRFEEGKTGPCAIAVVAGEDGIETTVKVRTAEEQRAIQATPASFVGRRLDISYQLRTPSGSYRHPVWERLQPAERSEK